MSNSYMQNLYTLKYLRNYSIKILFLKIIIIDKALLFIFLVYSCIISKSTTVYTVVLFVINKQYFGL